ncbi:hypothetical protein [Pelagibius sp. Alg239-R121]|uniref:hypothetical protein n=1 Tax=Pelagibius sp. Alg239-R121 TaxID=2993448 RepID=UPI0024A67BDF|nr:hypothetical protein [Pelagibius sp. Alg239-R121]
MTIVARRLQTEPIIFPDIDDRMGDNICGPSLIRVPDWVQHPLGRYYLYFAHHKGRYIRMAFADSPFGPWRTYVPGVLDVEQSLFEPEDPPEPAEAERPDWTKSLKGGYLYAHVASPDVHIDQSGMQIRMYYHGLLANGDQQTRVAYSSDGLSFTPHPPLLGPTYFRVFQNAGFVYAISWGGRFLRSRAWDGPFEPGPVLPDVKTADQPDRVIRHAAVFLRKQDLHLFFTCIGDQPEHILHTKIALSPNWENWRAGPLDVILEPDLDWEGAGLPETKSEMGAADGPRRELRDPCIFEEEGVVYLLYCGAGESGGIGLATLDWSCAGNPPD